MHLTTQYGRALQEQLKDEGAAIQPSLVGRSRLSLPTVLQVGCLIPLFLLACNPGQMSTCASADQSNCPPSSSPTEIVLDGGSSSERPRLPNIDIKRFFKEAARVPLHSGQQFAGLHQNEAIVTDGKKRVWRLSGRFAGGSLDHITIEISSSINFPKWYISLRDKIYFTKLSPYFIEYAPRSTTVYDASEMKVWSSGTDQASPPLRAFSDSQTSSFSVTALLYNTTHFYAELAGTAVQHSIKHQKISAHVIGDLDKLDKSDNGLEFITITSDGVETIKHQSMDTPGGSDPELAKALSLALVRPAAGLSISSACIVDINNDGYMDFLYSIGGTLQAATYSGRSWITAGKGFLPWPTGSLPSLATAEILSINPINIDGDPSTDLLIETKESLIYLLSTPAK